MLFYLLTNLGWYIHYVYMHFTTYVIITYTFGSVHEKVGVWIKWVTSKLKQGAHIHQPMAITSRICTAISRRQGQPWTAVSPLAYWGSSAWHSHQSVTGKTRVWRPFPAEVSPSSASSTQHMWELLAGNHMTVLPRHARGKRIMGLVYVRPLL